MDKSNLEFPISIYGSIEKFNNTLSKARCRIFYKGANRNGTFITDEFAKELISTLHYVPVKGIYKKDEVEEGDFTDHGHARSEGQIYGIVPENNNFAWEEHVDEDNVPRTYACTDVLLFTALYPEAGEIVGKGQSMELYEPSIQYHFSIVDSQKYVVFDHGSFLGLQVLGDTVEPCFEGASFFSLQDSIQKIVDKIKEYSKTGGESEMPKINFKLSDSDNHDAIFALLNPEFNEEGNWTCNYTVVEVSDDCALAYNYEEGCYERVYFTKDEESQAITLGDKVKVYTVAVTEEEKATVDALKALNGDTYELVSENLTNAEQNAANCLEFSTKIEELNATIATLNTEIESEKAKVEEVSTAYANAQTLNQSLTEENESLKTYKKSIEDQSKEAVVSEYANKLSEEVLDTYRAKFDEYTVEDLDMHLAYELKKTGASLYSQTSAGCLPKVGAEQRSSVEEIIARHKK